jgi:hypothetical protein
LLLSQRQAAAGLQGLALLLLLLVLLLAAAS